MIAQEASAWAEDPEAFGKLAEAYAQSLQSADLCMRAILASTASYALTRYIARRYRIPALRH
jgi:hypothetical protein